jgi:UDP-N-acetylglucosamine transferase subunit ALG13
MVFVIFGTIPVPFPRLAEKVDELAGRSGERYLVQSGHTRFDFRNAQDVRFLASTEMERCIREATLIIAHGGYGTICDCLRLGKKVIAVPRRRGEHNHDQRELVRALEMAGNVMAAYETDQLEATIARCADFVPAPLPRGDGAKVINQFIRDAVSGGRLPAAGN